MTDKEIQNISSLLYKYHVIANSPNNKNNIVIENNKISIIIDGKSSFVRKLDYSDFMQQVSNCNYFYKNIFKQEDFKYNPLEADRDENYKYWCEKNKYINFPKFISVLLFSLLYCGKIPSIIDFYRIYMNTYTNVLNATSPFRYIYYSETVRPEIISGLDRIRVNKNIVLPDGNILINRLLGFKAEFEIEYVKNLPLNEFTTEHLCSRIYKLYGSIIRDVHMPLYFNMLGCKCHYNFLSDLNGIDLFIDNVPVYAYTRTRNGEEFRKDKKDNRHNNLPNYGVEFLKTIFNQKFSGVDLISEKAAKEILECVEKIHLGDKRIYKVEG